VKNHSVFTLFIGIVSVFTIFGCSSGGSSDGAAGEDIQTSISTKSAYPGDFIAVTHSSIEEGEASTVTFTVDNGYEIEFETEDTARGIVRFSVPFYLDMETGENTSGTVTVSVNGNSIEDGFTIFAIPELDIKPGEVYARILEKIIENYDEAENHLWNIFNDEGIDLMDAIDELFEKKSQYLLMINEIRNAGTLTLSVNDGEDPVTLTAEDLTMLDQWLAVWILGMDAALRGPSAMSAGGIDFENWTQISGEERLQRIQAGIENVVDEFKRGVEGGKVWIGGITLVFTAAGFLVGGPAGAAIGAAAGLALGYISAGYELGTSAIFSRICDSFSEKVRPAYDWTTNILGQAVRIGLSAAGGLKDGIGKLFTLISSAVTLKDSVDAAEKTRCDDQSKSGGSSVLPAGLSAVYTIDEFCDDSQTPLPDDDIISDLLSAQISISIPDAADYYLNFSPEYVQAVFSDIDDGATLDMIPAIIGSNTPLNNIGFNSTSLTVMIHPYLNLSGDSPWLLTIDPEKELFDGDEAEIIFFTSQIRNETPLNDPVIFSAVGGTISLEVYGTQDMDLLKGTFSVTVEGDKDYWDYASEDIDYWETLTGTISGSFDGVLSDNPGN
jgi:hypothetical protein